MGKIRRIYQPVFAILIGCLISFPSHSTEESLTIVVDEVPLRNNLSFAIRKNKLWNYAREQFSRSFHSSDIKLSNQDVCIFHHIQTDFQKNAETELLFEKKEQKSQVTPHVIPGEYFIENLHTRLDANEDLMKIDVFFSTQLKVGLKKENFWNMWKQGKKPRVGRYIESPIDTSYKVSCTLFLPDSKEYMIDVSEDVLVKKINEVIRFKFYERDPKSLAGKS